MFYGHFAEASQLLAVGSRCHLRRALAAPAGSASCPRYLHFDVRALPPLTRHAVAHPF
jgi:hypothetical protein